MGKLLSFYSLLPGIAKLTGSSIFFGLNIPIIIFLLFWGRIKNVNLLKITTVVVVIVFVIYSFFLSNLINKEFSYNAFLSALYIWIFPMVGVYLADRYDNDSCYKVFVNIALLHTIIALLIYGFFPLPSLLQDFADTLLEGVAFFRLSSVSGSLIFSTIVSCGFNCHILLISKVNNGNTSLFDWLILFVLLFSVLLSLQRSAWLAILPSFLFFIFSDKKRTLYMLILSVPFFCAISVLVFNNDFYYERVMTLFSKENSPVDERFELWLYGLSQFNNNVMGLGIGQAGQFAYKSGVILDSYITDGDYIKILTEGGILFALFYLILILRIGVSYFYQIKNKFHYSTLSLFVVLGFFIQMIGSNISEYYFANFLFWACIGLFLTNDEC